MTEAAIRLVEDYTGHSTHVDRIRAYADGLPVQPFEIAGIAAKAVAELIAAVATNDVDGIIAADRRLVAVGGLAKANADRLEAGR